MLRKRVQNMPVAHVDARAPGTQQRSDDGLARPSPTSLVAMRLSFGSAQLHKKGEDTLYVDASDPDSSLFAVFDGHGGPQAAVLCRDKLCPSILASVRPVSTESVEEAFWSADSALSEQGQFAGTTATVLCVDRTAGGGFSCLLSWVGDSTAIVVDMLAPCATKSVVRSATTTDHNASNASETRRLRVEALVRESLELLTNDPLAPPSVAQVEAAWAAALPDESPLSTDAACVLTRELARGARLETLEADRIAAHGAAAGPTAKKHVRRRSRQPSHLSPRPHRPAGSKPALTTYHRFDDQLPAQRGASLMMTRSIGDWDAARALTPHPQSLRFAVCAAGAADGEGGGAAAPPQRWAVVLASDGLWDQVPHERAAAVVRAAVDPQGAADALVKLATVGRATPKDDTSVIVVDLNPAELPPQTPRCGGSRSCVVA